MPKILVVDDEPGVRESLRLVFGKDFRITEAGSAEEGALYAVRAGDKAARDLFAYSIGYLTVLFAALIVEHAFGAYVAIPGVG